MFYYHFLRQDYGAAVAYADKLEPFCGSEPSFRWNKALALAECGYYGEAKRAMQKIDDQEYEAFTRDKPTFFEGRNLKVTAL